MKMVNEINEKFQIETNFLEVLQLRQAIPFEWRLLLNSESEITDYLRYFSEWPV